MTAENSGGRWLSGAGVRASMRPRPMTAENVHGLLQIQPVDRRASMRPRPMTAENGSHRCGCAPGGMTLQ